MRFTAIARIDIVARAVGVATSIAFAMAGWGYWSLVMGACALALSTANRRIDPVSMDAGPSAKTFRISGDAEVCMAHQARDSASTTSPAIPTIFWWVGVSARPPWASTRRLTICFALSASQLVSATSNVAVSALSRVRDDRRQYMRYVLGAIAVMSFIGMGLAGDLTLVGKDLIRLLLGPNWGPAGVIFTYFARASAS